MHNQLAVRRRGHGQRDDEHVAGMITAATIVKITMKESRP